MNPNVDSRDGASGQTPTTGPTGGDLLGVLSDVETRLTALKQAAAERDAARRQIESRLGEVEQRERALVEAVQKAQAAQAEVEARAEQTRERESALDQTAHELDRARQEVAAAQARLASAQEALNQQSAQLERDRQAMDAMSSELASREDAWRKRIEEAEQVKALEAELRTSAARAREEAEAKAALLEQANKRVEEARTELKQMRDTAGAREAEAARLGAELAQLRAAAAQAGESRGKQTEALEARVAALTEELAAVRADAARTIELTGAARTELERLRASEAAATARVNELESEVGRLSGARRDGESAAQQAASRAEALARDVATRDETIRTLHAELAQARSAAGARAEAGERAETLAKQLQAREGEMRELGAALVEARKIGGEAAAARAELGQQLERAETELRCARTAMDESAAKVRTLEAELGGLRASGGGGAPRSDDATESRRLRLARVHAAIKAERRKLHEAGDAVRERYERAEQVLAQRQELVKARNAMLEAQRRVDKAQAQAAKSRAATFTLALVGILTLLAGVSWMIAAEFAPATYAVKGTLAADGRGRILGPEELAEWYRYHDALLKDPQTAQLAAQRFASRGMTKLGTPGAVSQRLAKDLSWESTSPGELTIELRGEGASRTERELSTFVTAVLSRSNANMEERTDGAHTVLAGAVSAGRGAIADDRLRFALMVFALGMGGTSLLGFGVWKRLASAKVRFEQEAQIDAILDEANWGNLQPDQTRPEPPAAAPAPAPAPAAPASPKAAPRAQAKTPGAGPGVGIAALQSVPRTKGRRG